MPYGSTFTRSLNILRRLVRRNEGQDLIEYGLLIGMLSVALVVSLGNVSNRVSQMWGTTESVLPGDTPSSGTPSDPDNGNGNPGNGNPGNGNPGNGNPGNGNPGNGNPGNGNPGNSNGNPGNSNPGKGGNGN